MQNDSRGFSGVWISKEVLDSPGLTSSEKILFANIASFAKCCFETNERLASKCGLSEATIKRSLQKLQEQGFIAIEFVNGSKSRRRIYAIMDNPRKIQYLVKKGLLKMPNNREEQQPFPQTFPPIVQDDLSTQAAAQNELSTAQNELSANREVIAQNELQRIKKKEEKASYEQKPNLKTEPDERLKMGRSSGMAPSRNNYKSDKEFEDAWYAWRSGAAIAT